MAFGKNEKLKDAEAVGHLKTLPEATQLPELGKEQEDICSTPEQFRTAIGRAQMDRLDYIEVTEELFNYLVKNQKTGYLTYGDPGIKVFKAGTRDQIIREESMNAEDYANMIGRRRMAQFNQ